MQTETQYRWRIATLTAILLTHSNIVLSNEVGQQRDQTVVYDVEFFSRFNPGTALDMIDRLPGFNLENADARRGFGTAAGNLLVNGERPSTKGQSLSELLKQIPANSVLRIELIRGQIPGLDTGSQSVIANVVRKSGKLGGYAEIELRLSEAGRVTPNGQASLSGTKFGADYTISIRRFAFEDIDDQHEDLLSPEKALLEFRPEKAEILPDRWTITANLEGTLGPWKARLNNELLVSNFEFRENSPSFSADDQQFLRQNTTNVKDKEIGYEVGGDIERDLSPTLGLKIVALQNINDLDSSQFFIEEEADGTGSNVTQSISSSKGESILRGVLTNQRASNHSLEVGLEGAYNFLDSEVTLIVDDGLGPTPISLPNSDTKVTERRGEIFVNSNWRFSSAFAITAGATAEFSSLKQSGSEENRRTFLFWKPLVNITWDLPAGNQLRFILERDVAQLDFSDFVSSATLAEQTTDVGNPQLEPQRDWIVRSEWEKRFSETSNLTLLAEYRLLERVQSLVPIAGEFDGPGNIGSGRQFRAKASWQFALDNFGIRNSIFKGSYQFQESSVTDPVTGTKRTRSYSSPENPFNKHRLNIEFRQDFPGSRIAWGAEYAYWSSFSEFRIDERRRTKFGPENVDIFVETTRIQGAKIRLEAGINEPRVIRDRFLFQGSRAATSLANIERRNRKPEKHILLTIRKSF